MRARTWCVGVLVGCSALAVARHALGQNPPGQLPRYRVDVVEYTSFGGYGYDINDRGQVALPSSSTDVQFSYVARRWDPRDGFLNLAPERSFATGINNQGDVTVIHEGGDYRSMSALWTERDGPIDLGTIGRQTWAEDVNDRQVVVGWTERDTDARERYAFRWTRDGGLATLPNLPGGSHEGGDAFDVTNRGLIVGYSYGANGQEAVRWVDGKVQGLGDFAGGWYESAATAANERGQIVGVGHLEGDGSDLNGDGQPDSVAHAFLWSEEKGMVDLGALGADHNSVAYDITDDGMVVGYSVRRPGGTSLAFKPFVWTEETGIVDVHTLLDEDFQQWQLGAFQMGRVNESGQLLLHGALNGEFAVVVLTPVNNPEPSAILLMAGAGAALVMRRVRRV
ncbi:MAG TPA: PEP-CTERM sorting domain-containing protein [Tepidisphaeraceae bacterium]|nr:PEP-CTERM sorting domain-containing protein [Tepidisphaeraceae bacterium]